MEYSYWVVNAKTLEIIVFNSIKKVNHLCKQGKDFEYYVFLHNPTEQEIKDVKDDFKYIQDIKRGKYE